MSYRQRDIVAQRLRDLDKMRRYLDYSTQRMRQGDIAARERGLLNDAEAEILAAFRVRFAEYQEHLGKLLKAIALEEGVALVGMADVLAFAEKAHLIDKKLAVPHAGHFIPPAPTLGEKR